MIPKPRHPVSENPLVSIIIVNYNGEDLLKSCLDSIYGNSYPNFEVILVDNGSEDGSVRLVREHYPGAKILELEKNLGFAYPNNLGAAKAGGEYLLFLNNDTIATPGFLTELVSAAQDNDRVGSCQSLLLDADHNVDSSGDFIDRLGVSFSSKERISGPRRMLSAKAASMLMRKDVFSQLGGFDEKFFLSFEDVDLGWRLCILGYENYTVPSSVVFHLGGQTTKRLGGEISFHGAKNQLSMKVTNFELPASLRAVLGFLAVYGLREMRIKLDYALRGSTSVTPTKYETGAAQNPDIKIVLKSILWLLQNIRYLNKKRVWIKSRRRCSTGDLITRGLILK